MATTESLRETIAAERRRREAFAEADLMAWVQEGQGQAALEALVFFATPGNFLSYAEQLRQEIRSGFNAGDVGLQEHNLRFVADLTLALHSFLPRWNLQNASRHGKGVLTDSQVKGEADKVQALAVELAARAPAVAEKLLAGWRAETAARLKAEAASDPQGEAQALVGNSVGEYLANVSAAAARSHLRRIAEMQFAGQTRTELSNDYAAFLQYTLYLGASFVTCNPVLVDIAWVADPGHWNAVVDSIVADHPDADGDALARLVTLEIVLTNMRLLRPIFLLTEGRMGSVSLQVNPQKHGDAGTMISDALSIYAELKARLDGGVPNVVFKLPGTQAGLEACHTLTKQGIGVNITVNFAMFQHLPFAQAIREGQALFSCLSHMSGRLAFPVRDELLAKLDKLAAYGINEAQAREAAAWSGVAVLKRLYQLLSAKGYDQSRIKPLIASLRIYEGDSFKNLPSAFPDITEVVGTSIITVFPNIRRPFDAQPEMDLEPLRIEAPVPADILERLTHSETFKQAYYVADRAWATEGDKRFRPDHELTLAAEEDVAAWTPVYNTLTEFQRSYDTFVQRILERKQLMIK